MARPEVERRCHLCIDGGKMERRKTIRYRGDLYTFPFPIYLCERHGHFVWRGRRYTPANFDELKSSAINVQPAPAGSPKDAYAEAPWKMIKCPHCGHRWKMQLTPRTVSDGKTLCPRCETEVMLPDTLDEEA